MSIPEPSELAELRDLLRQVMRGLRHRRRPPEALHRLVHGGLARGGERGGERDGIGPRHLSILAHIAAEGPRTVGEIAEEVGLTLPAASMLARALEDRGLVDRREDPEDRRRTLVDLNPVTEQEVRAWLGQRNAPLDTALTGLSPAERKAFLKGLRLLADALMEESPRGPLRSHDHPSHRRRQHRHRPL